jgi:hypothetical protein
MRFMSLKDAMLPTLRCTSTSPGRRPISSLAGTRASAQPILHPRRRGREAAQRHGRMERRGGRATAIQPSRPSALRCFSVPGARRPHQSTSGASRPTNLLKYPGDFSSNDRDHALNGSR